MTRATVTKETNDCTSIVSSTQRDRGRMSVGLKAVALMNDRQR